MTSIIAVKYVFALFVLTILLLVIKHQKVRISKVELCILAIFFTILFHSIFFSSDIEKSVERSIFSLVFLFMLLSIKLVFKKKLLKYIQKSLLIFGVLNVVLCNFILIALGKSSSFYIEGNFTGLSSNANTFGLLLAVFFLPAAIATFLNINNKKSKYALFIILYIINLVVLILETRSRAALGVCIVSFLVAILLKYRKKSSRILLVSLFTFILFPIFLLIQDSIFNKYENSANTDNSVFSTRMVLWVHRLEGIEEKPYIGWGFQVNSAKDKFYGAHVFNELEKGNTPLALIEEFGIPFGLLIIFFFYSLAIRFLSLNLENSLIPLIVIGAASHSMLETWLFNFNGYYAWILWLVIFIGGSELISSKRKANMLEEK